MGAIYEARHPVIGRRVAVKILRRELALDEDLVVRFFNEARATNVVCHPNIIEIIDVGRLSDGIPYLVMELLDGESLAQRLLRVGRLDVGHAIDLLKQAASALHAAHELGIVHRDLKPEHLFLTSDANQPGHDHVKLLDFGIAKLRGDHVLANVRTNAGTIFGTPQYMSPEQCLGLPDLVDARTDVYALGVILYEAICGVPPFVSEGYGDLMMKHMSCAPVPPSAHRPGLSEPVEHIILKALEKKRSDRYASMAELSLALADIAETPSASAAGASRPGTTGAERREPQPGATQATVLTFSQPGTDQSHEHQTERIGMSPGPTQSVSLDAPGHDAPLAPGQFSTPLGSGAPAPAPAATPRRRRGLVVLSIAGAVGVSLLLLRPAFREVTSHDAVEPLRPALTQPVSGTDTALPAARAALEPDPELRAPGESPRAGAANATAAKLATPAKPKPALAGSNAARPGAAIAPSPRAPAVLPPRAADVPAPTPPLVAAPAAPPGLLSFDSAPWSKVFLGSRELGTTPLLGVSLPAGRNVLTLKNSELGLSTTYVVDVPPGGNVSRFVGWGKE